MIEYQKRISRSDLRANRNKLYVFGDNLLRRGFGGQAGQMRGEPNAVGIPTKRTPDMREAAFFRDDDFNEWMESARGDLDRVSAFDGIVVWPADGIGTGLAELPSRSPRIWGCLEEFRQWVERQQIIPR